MNSLTDLRDVVDVVIGIDIDTAHELDKRSCLGPIVAAGFVQIFADQM